MNEPVLKKAMDTLQFLSQDSEARRIYEARQKYLHDEASMIDGAETKGREKGIAEGKLKGKLEAKLEIARKLLGMGLSFEEIQEATGLSEQEIQSINP